MEIISEPAEVIKAPADARATRNSSATRWSRLSSRSSRSSWRTSFSKQSVYNRKTMSQYGLYQQEQEAQQQMQLLGFTNYEQQLLQHAQLQMTQMGMPYDPMEQLHAFQVGMYGAMQLSPIELQQYTQQRQNEILLRQMAQMQRIQLYEQQRISTYSGSNQFKSAPTKGNKRASIDTKSTAATGHTTTTGGSQKTTSITAARPQDVPWTVIIVDEDALPKGAALRQEVAQGLTALKVKTYKNTVKCMRFLAKKNSFDRYLFVCGPDDATVLARYIDGKHPQPSMLVYGGTPNLPFPYKTTEIANLAQNIAEWTGSTLRAPNSADGVQYTTLWISEQVFKSEGRIRKASLELLDGCIGLKTYKSADKCIRAIAKKTKLQNVAFVVTDTEAHEILKHLSTRNETAPVIVDCSLSPAQTFNPSHVSDYESKNIIVTHKWDDIIAKAPGFFLQNIRSHPPPT